MDSEKQYDCPVTICLCMIVRDEAAVIGRAVESVRDIIHAYAIVDTGSTDETPAIAADLLKEVSGQVYREPWVNFGHNRTQAIQLARAAGCDYVLVMDADMTANVKDPEFRGRLELDSYSIRYEGDLDYYQAMLLSAAHEWKYIGVTHEYVYSETAKTQAVLEGLTLTHHADGSQRKNKCERDIALLTEALITEPENPRYWFYLAQSYRDAGTASRSDSVIGRAAAAGLANSALACYQRRSRMAGWDQETWYSLYQCAALAESRGEWPAAVEGYLAAYQFRPSRAEPLYCIGLHYNRAGQYWLAYLFLSAAAAIPYPDDQLFIERPVYEHLIPLELAVAAHYVGRLAQAVALNDELLAGGKLPAGLTELVQKNRAFSAVAGSTTAPFGQRAGVGAGE